MGMCDLLGLTSLMYRWQSCETWPDPWQGNLQKTRRLRCMSPSGGGEGRVEIMHMRRAHCTVQSNIEMRCIAKWSNNVIECTR